MLPIVTTSEDATIDLGQKFEHQMSRISGQSGVFFLGTIFTAATGYFLKVYLARKLGADALGIYALGMTIVGVVNLMSAWGLPQSAVRFVAEYNTLRQFDNLRNFILRCFIILSGFSLALGGGMILIGPKIARSFYHSDALASYFSLFALIAMLGVLTLFFGQVLAGYQDVARRTVITNFVGAPLTVILAALLVALGYGLRGYLVAQIIAAAVALVLLAWVAWRRTPVEARRSFGWGAPLSKEVISFSMAVFWVNILTFLLAQADKILLGFYLNVGEVGVYAVAASLVAFVPIILQSVNQIFAPMIAELHAHNERDLLCRLFQSLTKWIIALTLPLASVMIIFAVPLMRVFGLDFQRGWIILVIGVVGQIVNCATGPAGFLLLMSGHQKRLLRIQAISAVLIIALNLLLIPLWGIVGAALASAAMAIVSNLLYLVEVRRTLGLIPYTRAYGRLALPLGLACASPWLVHYTVRSTGLLAVALGLVLSYSILGLSISLIGLEADDRRVGRMIWSRVAGVLRRA